MPKSPRRGTSLPDSNQMHKGARWVVASAIFTTLIVAIVYTALAGKLMLEVHEEGSNPRNAGDTSLTDKEQDHQKYSGAAFTAYIFTFLLTFIYMSMKM